MERTKVLTPPQSAYFAEVMQALKTVPIVEQNQARVHKTIARRESVHGKTRNDPRKLEQVLPNCDCI
jgi:hypothetical protein